MTQAKFERFLIVLVFCVFLTTAYLTTTSTALAKQNLDLLNHALNLATFKVATASGNVQVGLDESGLTLSTHQVGDRLVLRPDFDFLTGPSNLHHFTVRYDFIIPIVPATSYEFPLNYQNENNYVSWIFYLENNQTHAKLRTVRGGQVVDTYVERIYSPWFKAGRSYTFLYIYDSGLVKLRFWPKDCYQAETCGNDFSYLRSGTTAIATPVYVVLNYGPALAVSHTAMVPESLSLTYQNFFIFDYDGGWTLEVPFFSQLDPAWKDEELGQARAFDNEATIGSHGCAITSAAMLLHYYGYTVMPDGSALNPSTLNAWLAAEPGAYFSGTYLVWQQLVKLAAQIRTTHPGLDVQEFKIVPTTLVEETSSLDYRTTVHDLTAAGEPVILALDNHFMVATGLNFNPHQILSNDPWQSQATSVFTEYNGPYGFLKSYRRFISGNQLNQSSIVINYTGALRIKIWDAKTQRFIGSSTGTRVLGQDLFKQVYVNLPADGHYTIMISRDSYDQNTDPARYNIMAYDKLGNDQVFFLNPYTLLTSQASSQQRSFASLAVNSEAPPTQDQYSVLYTLDFSQDPEVGTRLSLPNAVNSLHDLWQVLVTSRTPGFVVWQIQSLERAWQNALWQDDRDFLVLQRYFKLLKQYLQHYAEQGWLDSFATESILEQLTALEPYLLE